MLTAPFSGETLESVIEFADNVSIPCLEVVAHPGSTHIDPARLTKARASAIRALLEDRGVQISALGYYEPAITDPKRTRAVQAHMRKTIDACVLLGVPVVTMLCGFPAAGMTKVETIRQVLPKVLAPVLDHAKKCKVKLAAENWYETCLQGLDTFEELFKAVPHGNLGLNYDPSHLYHQECDHLAPVSLYKDRIFHTHAKDTLVNAAVKARVGVLGKGWWRYVVPGFGNIAWGEYISHLRQNGYDGVLSIEHEDEAQTREEGFMRGAWYLEQFC
jgi:sugar phosphate isomerase/epimerase